LAFLKKPSHAIPEFDFNIKSNVSTFIESLPLIFYHHQQQQQAAAVISSSSTISYLVYFFI
jgi:hypothetical protein